MPISPQITITPETITTKSFNITAVTYTSSTATYTATGHTFAVGDIVLITEVAPDGYNGSFTITATATNTFTVANTTNAVVTTATGNAFWASSTDYDLGAYSATYPTDSTDLAVVETIANGKNKVYRQGTTPSGTFTVGDIWFDTSNGNRQYYWDGSTWVDLQDTAIAAASSAASAASTAATAALTAATAAAAAAVAAQSTADGKNKVYRQGTTPSGTFAVGDLWFDTSNDNKISRWDGSSWVANTLGNNALASISANKLNAGSIDASVITVSNINAGNISTGYLAAARIQAASLDASVLVAGSITATQITSGTITATQIATGTITSSKIATGTITASNIAAATITSTEIATGTITASNIAANTITASKIAAGTITATEISSSYVYAGTIAAGNITAGTVTASVAFNAASGTFSGTVTASAGTIGGWKLSGSSLYTGTAGSETQYLSSSGGGLLTGTYTIGSLGVNTTLTVGSTATVTGDIYAQQAISSSTSAATNCYISTTGQIRKTSTTSSRRYKENITDIFSVTELNPKALLNLPVRAFTYKEGHIPATDDRAGIMLPGFIAEEMDAVYPIAVDYENGVETWNSFYLVPALLALIQDQEARIKTLEGK